MISFHRRREGPPFLASEPLRDLSRETGLHATARQCLYRYLTRLRAAAAGPMRALIPDYAPEGIYAPLRAAGLSVSFYPMPLDLRLDPAAIGRAVSAERPDLIVYIHPFGLYLEENLDTLRAALPAGASLLEDFALTLPCAEVAPRGDLALYAFSKLLGVPEGGLLKPTGPGFGSPGKPASGVPSRLAGPADAYGAPTPEGRELSARLDRQLALQDRMARTGAGLLLQRLLTWAAGTGAEYYPYLTAHYRAIGESIAEPSRKLLERIDFEAVTRRRRELAGLYLRGLDPRFRMAEDAAYLRQALCAFPVRVDDQEGFHAFLIRGGVQGYRLTDRWWFPPGPPSPLHRGHYLLPLGHSLSEREVRRVIDRVNAYAPARRD
jgi:hypothetical protein